jgi:hypothetical protein
MKHLARLLVALGCLALGVPAIYAACFYPKARTVTYYQRHTSCGEPVGPRGLRPCIDYWSADGECTTDCDGSTYCSGDTQARQDTQYDFQVDGSCPPICE